MEYKIVSCPNTRVLMDKVNELLSRGWQLQGGVAYMPSTGTWAASCHQAMIKIDERDETVGPYD